MTSVPCPSADTLIDYADGQLPAEQHRAVVDHLSSCMACSAFLNGLAAVDRQLEDLAQEPVQVPDVGDAYERFRRRYPSPGARPRAHAWLDRGFDLFEHPLPLSGTAWSAARVAGTLFAGGILVYAAPRAWRHLRRGDKNSPGLTSATAG